MQKVMELHGMLKTVEEDIKKGTRQVLMAQNKAKLKKSFGQRRRPSRRVVRLRM
jgi:hypothetical protein